MSGTEGAELSPRPDADPGSIARPRFVGPPRSTTARSGAGRTGSRGSQDAGMPRSVVTGSRSGVTRRSFRASLRSREPAMAGISSRLRSGVGRPCPAFGSVERRPGLVLALGEHKAFWRSLVSAARTVCGSHPRTSPSTATLRPSGSESRLMSRACLVCHGCSGPTELALVFAAALMSGTGELNAAARFPVASLGLPDALTFRAGSSAGTEA